MKMPADPGGGRARRPAAFTLLELLIAIVILVVGILGFIAALNQGARLQEISRETTIASNAASDKMEEVKAYARDNFGNTYTTYNNQNFSVPGLKVRAGDADGLAGQVVVDNTDPSNLRVTVEVDWKHYFGDRHWEISTILNSNL